MSRQFLYLALLMITSACSVYGQYYFYDDKYYNSLTLVEAGISVGGMNCLTDLGGRKGKGSRFLKDINWNKSHLCAGVYFSLLYNQLFALRAEASMGKVSADDNVLREDHSTARDRYNRNLHFKSSIAELYIVAECYPLSWLNGGSYPLFSPYLLGGIGFFRYNPMAKYEGQWMELNPLHTEGQGFKEYSPKQPYKLFQLNFPVGLGARYEMSALVSIRFELVYRFLKTDYLDDVSTQYIDPRMFYLYLDPQDAKIAERLADRSGELHQGVINKAGEIRGNPQNRDAYFSFNVKAGMILNRKRR